MGPPGWSVPLLPGAMSEMGARHMADGGLEGVSQSTPSLCVWESFVVTILKVAGARWLGNP